MTPRSVYPVVFPTIARRSFSYIYWCVQFDLQCSCAGMTSRRTPLLMHLMHRPYAEPQVCGPLLGVCHVCGEGCPLFFALPSSPPTHGHSAYCRVFRDVLSELMLSCYPSHPGPAFSAALTASLVAAFQLPCASLKRIRSPSAVEVDPDSADSQLISPRPFVNCSCTPWKYALNVCNSSATSGHLPAVTQRCPPCIHSATMRSW